MAKTILLAEDEEIMLKLLEKKLSQAGYEVISAADGQEALDKIKENFPDLILLDVVMPRLSGFEVLKMINQDEKLKKIPVIIISNSGQPVEINKAVELGAKDWIIKTDFNPQEVVEKVQKYL